jgi:hypothetical protein
MSKMTGDSESNLRKAFEDAEANAPSMFDLIMSFYLFIFLFFFFFFVILFFFCLLVYLLMKLTQLHRKETKPMEKLKKELSLSVFYLFTFI